MKNIVGIDFGHGETSAGFLNSDNVVGGNEVRVADLRLVGEKIVIPSIVCIMPSEEVVIYPSANQIAKATEIGISFKDPLIESARYSKITADNYLYFKLFLTKTYEAIKCNPNNPLHTSAEGENDFLVYIACPSGWNQEQIDAYKEFANSECGIPVVDIVKESRAAYIAARRSVIGGIRTQGGNVLVIDYGSSTIDFTYFNNDNCFEPIHEGYKLGARMIEERFLQYLKEEEKEASENIAMVESRCGVQKAENVLLYAIRKKKEEYFVQPNQDYFSLLIDLRELLLDKSLSGIYIEPLSESGYSKQDVLNILSDYIEKLSKMLDDFLTKDGVTSVDKVILTGGASRMFFFKDLVAKKYNVKENDTLIFDLDTSVTISRGIAAFGYMKERALPAEKNLNDAVTSFIDNELEKVLRSAINNALWEFYCDELKKITDDYEKGYIKDESGKRSVYALKKAFGNFLQTHKAEAATISEKITPYMNSAISKSVKERLVAYVNTWAYNETDIRIEFEFNNSFSFSPETIQLMTIECAKMVENSIITFQSVLENLLGVYSELFVDILDGIIWILEDIFGLDIDPEFKDRDSDGRKIIVGRVNPKIIATCKTLTYDGPLSDECRIIGGAIRSKVKDIIDKAELEMYR